MNQFIQSWKFSLKNWKFFLILGLPVISIDIIYGYLVLPVEGMTQFEDIALYIDRNIGIFFLVIVIWFIVQISFLGELIGSEITLIVERYNLKKLESHLSKQRTTLELQMVNRSMI